jgi:hypothetical protein
MDKTIGNIAITLLHVSNQLKIYHWKTFSYARHKASCSLIENLTELTDKIIETIQGSKKIRLYIPDNSTIVLENVNDVSAVELLHNFENWLINIFPQYLTKDETELINLRDELLCHVKQTMYLFTFQ